ncbi:NUDIX domain-containing protein [Agromyces sp. CFH 90414]|uniref:NUDIX domain-containing protein n=1 Tax=Agromyces agglutinans TaxID=2662258 RepID=A0A6I2F9P4_9MICO|nr:NUDIX domain-containing protein [Agromyces agglutinans]MRG60964.1 NUDIX domain-containing protein [Agromyces agglutinans]
MPQHERDARLAVSTVIFALEPGVTPEGAERVASDRASLWIPLVRRLRDPGEGRWALPGGWLGAGEALEAAAARTLEETTGVTPRFLEQLYTFGAPDRSPGERVVSVVYWALVRPEETTGAIDDPNVRWFDPDDLPDLAFDHNAIVDYALTRLRSKLGYAQIAHSFLGPTFTIAELREVYETVLRVHLDPANFRRTVEASGALVETGEVRTGTRHRPPKLYRPAEAPTGDGMFRVPIAPHLRKSPS